jgi:hypothetical protein
LHVDLDYTVVYYSPGTPIAGIGVRARSTTHMHTQDILYAIYTQLARKELYGLISQNAMRRSFRVDKDAQRLDLKSVIAEHLQINVTTIKNDKRELLIKELYSIQPAVATGRR